MSHSCHGISRTQPHSTVFEETRRTGLRSSAALPVTRPHRPARRSRTQTPLLARVCGFEPHPGHTEHWVC